MRKQNTPVLIDALRSAGDSSPETLKRLGEELSLPLAHVAGVAGFYSEFNGMSDGEADFRFAQGGVEGPMLAPADYGAVFSLAAAGEKILPRLRDLSVLGRGGAAFPVADKWETVARSGAKQKYVVCNANEGEGETYKDMKLMLRAPHAIIEGIILCAAATGADRAIICVRSEYPECCESLEKELQNVKPDGLEIEVVRCAGAYVCGEETALLRFLEGRRGEPALKPPYPGERGLHGCPTVINNAESFAAAAAALLTGEVTKLFTVSGCVERPGLYELPYGVTPRELAEMAGANANIKGFRLGGGATGRVFGAENLDISLTPDGGLGTASVMFFDNTVSVRELCAESAAFLARQSCGKCVPCRLGSRELARLLKNGGSASEITGLCRYLKTASRCALGQSIPNCVESALSAFPGEFEAEGGAR